MRKSLVVLVVVLLACTLAVVAGCGGSKTESQSDAQKILKQSQDKMSEVETVKVTGKMVIGTPGAEVKQETADLSMEAKMVTPDEIEGHMVITESTGAKTDVYMSQGYVYTNDPATGWYKQKADEAGTSSTMMSPQDLEELSKYAENVTMTETGDEYKLTFDVGSEYFEKAMAAQYGDESTQTIPGSKELEEMMKSLIKGIEMSVTYTIDKSTMLARSADIKMTMKDAPMMGDVSIAMDLNFSDYGAPVEVALPAEAQSAQEVTPGTAMPSIPGLGI
ncbi:MAG: hypothetical protein KKE36_13225 [Actinobacteria bacterium]|nr:hypothetical protein [Actinomycetota bacterium]